MPLYIFQCSICQKQIKKLLTPEKAKESVFCNNGHLLERSESDITVLVKEVIDNGLQTKRQEQLADSAELMQEREDAVRQLKKKQSL